MAYAARLNLRMQKEMKLLLTDPPPGVSLLSPSCDNSSSSSSLSIFEARIKGPEETVYSGGSFAIRIKVPERYPFHPPSVTFVTPIYHPNIDNGGRICLDILNLPPKGAWRPSLNISTVLTSIGLLMSEPNPDDGLMYETSREYKYNRPAFDDKARFWTEKYAKDGYCTESCDDTATDTISKMDEVKQAKEVPVERDSNDEGCRKRICIGRQKLSLRDAFEKTTNDDKENVIPVNQEFSKSQDADVYSTKTESSKQRVACTKGCPGPEHAVDYSDRNNDQLNQGQKIAETYIVLDSEDSEEEENNRLRRSRLSQFRRRGEWKK